MACGGVAHGITCFSLTRSRMARGRAGLGGFIIEACKGAVMCITLSAMLGPAYHLGPSVRTTRRRVLGRHELPTESPPRLKIARTKAADRTQSAMHPTHRSIHLDGV